MCSNDITNQQIIDFVNNTYVPNNIFGGTYPSAYPGSIIYEVVNNMIPEKCSYPYAINNPYTISGLTNNSSTNIIDFTYFLFSSPLLTGRYLSRLYSFLGLMYLSKSFEFYYFGSVIGI